MQRNRSITALLASGHIIECFDNTLYGFFSVFLGPIFFPTYSQSATILASYGAFAAGFLARPVGAIIFGYIGDRFGRSKSLLLSMMLVGMPTVIIGLLPSYAYIGIFAPLLLILCRLFQGFFMGGEFSGVNLYLAETSPKSSLGRKTGNLIASGVGGAILATLIGALVTLPAMPGWLWRLPFILGGLSAFILFFFRLKMQETPEYQKAVSSRTILKNPWSVLFKHHKLKILVSAMLAGCTLVPLYCCSILGNKIFQKLGYSVYSSMLLNTFGMILDCCSVIYFGRVADRIGFYRHTILGLTAIIAVSIPAFYFIHHLNPQLYDVLFYILLLTGIGCMVNGSAMPYIAAYFPTNCRYSGMAISVTLGQALLGGMTPVIGSLLIDHFDTLAAPIIWVTGTAALTLVGILFVPNPVYNKQDAEPFGTPCMNH